MRAFIYYCLKGLVGVGTSTDSSITWKLTKCNSCKILSISLSCETQFRADSANDYSETPAREPQVEKYSKIFILVLLLSSCKRCSSSSITFPFSRASPFPPRNMVTRIFPRKSRSYIACASTRWSPTSCFSFERGELFSQLQGDFHHRQKRSVASDS